MINDNYYRDNTAYDREQRRRRQFLMVGALTLPVALYLTKKAEDYFWETSWGKQIRAKFPKIDNPLYIRPDAPQSYFDIIKNDFNYYKFTRLRDPNRLDVLFHATVFRWRPYGKRINKLMQRGAGGPFKVDPARVFPNKIAIASLPMLFLLSSVRSSLTGDASPTALITTPISEMLAIPAFSIGARAGSRFMFRMFGSRILAGIGGGLGGIAAGIIPYFGVQLIRNISKKAISSSLPELGGTYLDSANLQTMRARSLNAIRTSQFNVRMSLGNEAFRLATGMPM